MNSTLNPTISLPRRPAAAGGDGPAAADARLAAPAPPSRRTPAWRRLPLLLPGLLALVFGLVAGLWRLGAWAPEAPPAALLHAAIGHGALMVCGFFGVVIALERAVALAAAGPRGTASRWRAVPYTMPLLAATGTLAQLAGAPTLAATAWLLAALALLLATLAIWRRQPEPFVGVLALGAAAWACGNALLLAGAGVAAAVPWWLAFLVFTIAGERLELSRLAPRPPGAAVGFAVLMAAAALALLAHTLGVLAGGPLVPNDLGLGWADTGWVEPGARGFGAALLGLALWLWRHDLARRTLHQRGLPRYVAQCLLAGYAWLGLAGGLVALQGLQPGAAAWDAALHALLLGFVFSMVFGHAPIILPAVLRVAVPFAPRLLVPLVLLHASVALRVAGSLVGVPGLRQAGAWLSVLAIAAFIASVLSLVRRRQTSAQRTGQGSSLT
jgi:hypothetical protein